MLEEHKNPFSLIPRDVDGPILHWRRGLRRSLQRHYWPASFSASSTTLDPAGMQVASARANCPANHLLRPAFKPDCALIQSQAYGVCGDFGLGGVARPFSNHWDETSFASLREQFGRHRRSRPRVAACCSVVGEIGRDDSRKESHVPPGLKKTTRKLKSSRHQQFRCSKQRWDGESRHSP